MTPNSFSSARRWRALASQVLFVVCAIVPTASAWADWHGARPVTPGAPPPPPPGYRPPPPPSYQPPRPPQPAPPPPHYNPPPRPVPPPPRPPYYPPRPPYNPPPAYPPYNPPPGNSWTRCETESRGQVFRDAASTRQWAREQTIRSCAWGTRDEGECRYNLRCDNEYPGEWVRCRATSNGQWFFDGGLDYNFVRQGAIQRCEQSGYSRPGECAAYVSCDSAGLPSRNYPGQPGYPAPQPGFPDTGLASCTTQSQGRAFQATGYGWWNTRSSVIQACRTAGYTLAWECEGNVACR